MAAETGNFVNSRKAVKAFWLGLGFIMILLLGAIDYYSGFEFSFSIFYLAPIVLVTWRVGRTPGLVFSFLGALTWFAADAASGHLYSSAFIYSWNTIMRLGFFLIISMLLATLKKELQLQRELAHQDFLTGTANPRYFYDIVQMEIHRARRHGRPCSAAYIDLDNFKAVNDRLGHQVGDNVLCVVADCLKANVRVIDTVARLGGDEFVLFLPETEQEGARTVLTKIRCCLTGAMEQNDWQVGFSIGVLTFLSMPSTVDEMIRLVDGLMYAVKQSGKNDTRFSSYSFESAGDP
ncbi:MAG: GGDEF domain-containing protein [Candidatus Aminicenantes bacterium]|nr:GGDEF domain-containing protein [Candidatus Aminicenantes bacterium]